MNNRYIDVKERERREAILRDPELRALEEKRKKLKKEALKRKHNLDGFVIGDFRNVG